MKATFYVKFRPTFRGNKLYDVKAVSVTKHKPSDGFGSYVTVHFGVDFDPAIFSIPEVTASIGPGDAEIVAEVLPPHDISGAVI